MKRKKKKKRRKKLVVAAVARCRLKLVNKCSFKPGIALSDRKEYVSKKKTKNGKKLGLCSDKEGAPLLPALSLKKK